MPNWTKEQSLAINKEGQNIIVSAGAGSGKTAVLSERVIRKLKDGVNINEMLILTFTNAAAYEMKERIRKKISKEESLKRQLDLVDEAYITTFDSFSLSLVKKYHYLLNIDKNVEIIDSSIIYNEKTKILDEIMDEEYQNREPKFLKLIGDFCIKDDEDIKSYILNINDKMDLLMNKEEFLDNYISIYYDDSFIKSQIEKYLKRIDVKFEKIKELTRDLLSLSEDKFYDGVLEILNSYENAKSYSDIYSVIEKSLPRSPKNASDEVKTLKEKLSDTIKSFKEELAFSNVEEMKSAIMSTKDYAEVITRIIKKLHQRIKEFKYQNNSFEFNDIALMAIDIVKSNDDVRNYLKYFFKEIMIDEYQDTSNIQETFINLIENNNVYMVGDIKQSIYRFRHAEPKIFKNKYDNYSKNIGGFKIDLVKNFRSRKEVLDNINLIFDAVMDDVLGGANYQVSHRMVFGNNSYIEEGKTHQDYNLEVLNYEFDKNLGYSKDEIEIFTIVKDIKEKVDNHYQIFDKDECILRDVTYNDFCILLDRATKFDLYKKIFEYFNIPLTKYTSTNITQDDDIAIIKNILNLIIAVKEKRYDTDFRYSFMSVSRSYLIGLSDEEIFDYLNNNTYKESNLYQIILEIADSINYLSLSKILEVIIDKFSFYEKSITVGNIEKVGVRIEYLLNLASSMENMGYDIVSFSAYLDKLISSNIKMECEISDNTTSSVKIMTIHKSKGLEYHICYFAGLSAGFNISDLNDRFIFTKKYGIICPFYQEGIGDTIYKSMYKDDYLLDEISEKIRLFYVGLTRAKEKMIFVCSLEETTMESDVVSFDVKSKYKSFLDILNSIYTLLTPFKKDIDIKSLNLTHDYNLIKKTNYEDKIEKNDIVINNKEINIVNIVNSEVSEIHFSKTTNELHSREELDKMKLGTDIHYMLEVFDFKNPNFDIIPDKYREYVTSLLNSDIDFNGNIYKEYEFIYQDKNETKHGIIDLMIEYSDYINIIDYKLSNIDDDNYLKQLNGYKSYIENKTKKKVDIYLYSIIKRELRKL